MMGTYRNFLHRLGDAWNAIKGVPIAPGELYPPNQRNSGQSTHWINWQGWEAFSKEAQTEGQKDLQRAKTAVTSPWVFADVQAIANEFSTSELIVKERRGTKLEDVDNHPLEMIWESPNEHMGRSFVTAFWAWSYVLASKAYLYWVPDTSGTELMEVWPVPPWMIMPIPDKDEFIRGYAFKANQYADTIVLPPELITYSHSVNLFNVRDGLSFLAAADTDIRADLAASLWNLNFFDDNNGIPDGALMMSPDALDQDVERVRMELRDFYGGTKRGIVVGRSKDLTWQEYGRSQKDMEFGAGREFASKVIGRTLGFPDGYWSDLANRANAEQARRTMISGAVWPLLVRLSEDMNAARRGVVQRWYGEMMRVEFKDIRPEDKEAQRAELAAYTPFITVNELREIVGQEALDKDDPRGLMLVAEITKGAPLPGTPAALLLEDLQAKKDEQQAKELAAQVEAGTIPNPNEPPPEAPGAPPEAPGSTGAPPAEGEPAPPEAAAVKAQSAEERAMFAKMGGGKGPGKGYDKSKSVLTTHGEKDKAAGGGGGGGASSTSEGQASSTHSEALANALHTHERSIAINPYETAYVFDANGNKLFEKTGAPGTQHEVSFTDAEAKRLKGATLTHNHPHNVSFSRADVQTSIQHEIGEMRAVTGDHRYSLRIPPGTKWTPSLESHIKTRYDNMLTKAKADVAAGKRTVADVNRNLHHELWSSVAKEQGWAYTRNAWG